MRKNIIVAMASLAFLPAVSFAAAPTLSEVLDASGISVTGNFSGSYSYNHAAQDGTPSTSSNQFTFDQAHVMISKLPTSGFGAAVDVYAGEDVSGDTYNYGGMGGSYPVGGFNKFTGDTSSINLHQAYVQYATGNLTVVAGKFATLAGYEVASDAANFNATRSMVYSQQAFTLTGARAGYKFNDMVTAYVGLNNSVLGSTGDGDAHKTAELGVALAPMSGLIINVTDYIGTEGTNSRTNFADLVVAYTTGGLTVALNGDYNTVKVSGASTQKLAGGALYADYQFSNGYRAGVRAEHGTAKDGYLGFADAKATAVTLTGGYSPAKNVDLIADVRFADLKDNTSNTTEKDTLAVVKAVYKF